MIEHECLKGVKINNERPRQRGHAIKYEAKNSCTFMYVKGSDLNATKYFNKKIKYYKLCSNEFFCEHKSLFPFQIKKEKCIICGKETDLLENNKCLECEITEMADKKADEFINQEWAI